MIFKEAWGIRVITFMVLTHYFLSNNTNCEELTFYLSSRCLTMALLLRKAYLVC